MDFFENIIGCKILEHKAAYVERDERISSSARIFLKGIAIAIFLSMLLCMVWMLTAPALERSGRFAVTGIYLLVAVYFGGEVERKAEGFKHPERFVLEFSREMSALSLLEIQESFELQKTEEEGVWIATPKQKRSPLNHLFIKSGVKPLA